MIAPALEVAGLGIRYGRFIAVSGVDFTADAGAVTAILGPNGAGKTSVIDACTGLRRPWTGSVRLLDGTPADPAVRARIGVMLQEGGLYPTARPLEWLQYLSRLYPRSTDPGQLLERLGLDPRLRTATRRLSGGQAQRVKLAAALVHEPDLLFLDEPSAGMDPAARQSLLDLISELRSAGRTIVLSTHVIADIEDLADKVIVLAAGQVLASGTIEELTEADAALRFEGPPGLDLTSLAAGLPSGYAVSEVGGGRYLVEGHLSPKIVSRVAAWCAEHGALGSGLRPGRRSLADIVMSASDARAS